MEPTLAQAALHTDMSLLGLFAQAGLFVKVIMFTLLGMSVATWAIFIAKWSVLKHLHAKASRFEEAFWNGEGLEDLYKDTRPEDTDHTMAKLFVVGLKEWDRSRDKDGDITGIVQVGAIERVRQILFAKMGRELDSLEKGIGFLATTGSTAPFIGLLGTVWGIMTAFQGIGASGNASLAVVAPGIAEALLATAIGLFAAIPAVMAYNKLTLEMSRYAARLEGFLTEFTTLLERQQAEKVVKSRKINKKRRESDAA